MDIFTAATLGFVAGAVIASAFISYFPDHPATHWVNECDRFAPAALRWLGNEKVTAEEREYLLQLADDIERTAGLKS